MDADPNVQAAIEASQKFIAEHPDVPIVEVGAPRRSGHSKLVGRPLDDDGAIELKVQAEAPRPSAPNLDELWKKHGKRPLNDVIAAISESVQGELTRCHDHTLTPREQAAIIARSMHSICDCYIGILQKELVAESRPSAEEVREWFLKQPSHGEMHEHHGILWIPLERVPELLVKWMQERITRP